MFKNLFKPKPVDFAAPFKGRIMTLDEVPDPVLSLINILFPHQRDVGPRGRGLVVHVVGEADIGA